MMKPVIETKHLSCQFGEVTAVNHLSLTVYQGEVFGFLGHNGAGKTTTMRLLNGVLTETPSLDERLTGRQDFSN